MGRIVAIDYGAKRTGLAVTDNLHMIANRLTTVPGNEVVKFLTNYMLEETVDLFVVGYPKQMNNQPSENMKRIEPFVAQLKKAFPNIPVEYYDERFTSVIAQQTIIAAGVKKKKRQDKALTDEVSAVIILQSFLESKRNTLI